MRSSAGRIDHWLVRPAPPRNEQFHQAVASFLAFGRPPVPPETSVPGVLAAGDVRHGSIKRVASAVGGSIAIRYVHQLLASWSPAVRPGRVAHCPSRSRASA
jgi:hypothetical protein